MKALLPLAAMICTALSTVVAVVFCMSMGANASPQQWRAIQGWMLGLSLLGLGGILAAVLQMRAGRYGAAAAAAIAPTLLFVLILVLAAL